MANFKAAPGLILLILLLSLVTWVFFYFASMPLDSRATAVVCGGWALLVYVGKWLRSQFQKDRKEK
jgi:hypothetical protein